MRLVFLHTANQEKNVSLQHCRLPPTLATVVMPVVVASSALLLALLAAMLRGTLMVAPFFLPGGALKVCNCLLLDRGHQLRGRLLKFVELAVSSTGR